MDKKYEPLFTEWKIGNVVIKNRIVMLPMGGTCLFGFSEPNHFDKEAAKLILEIAKHDCGLIIPGIAPVHDMVAQNGSIKGKGSSANSSPSWMRSIRPGPSFSSNSPLALAVHSRSAKKSRRSGRTPSSES